MQVPQLQSLWAEVEQAQADPPAVAPVQTAVIVYFQQLPHLVVEAEADILALPSAMEHTPMVHWVEQVVEPRAVAALVLVLLAKVMPAVSAGLPVKQVARAVDSLVEAAGLMAPAARRAALVAPVAHLLYQGQA